MRRSGAVLSGTRGFVSDLLDRALRTVQRSIGSEDDSPDTSPPVPAQDTSFLEAAFWILIGREPSAVERRDGLRLIRQGDARREEWTRQLLSSTEFRIRYQAWQESWNDWRSARVVLDGLLRLGSHAHFIECCYRCLLGRAPDESGRAHYIQRFEMGDNRLQLVRTLALSDEFAERFRHLCPVQRVPVDTQLCELANPAKWDNRDWLELLQSLKAGPADKSSMHRKAYEYTQTVYGLTQLRRLDENTRVLSVGAGHECLLYWLANRVGQVIATDMYDERWSESRGGEGDASVLARPDQHAPFPYRKDRLVFLKMDGRLLGIADASCDVVYSLSSIEHFGGVTGARKAIHEMVRVLKPGGILAVATEWQLSGPSHPEVFRRDEVHAIITHPSLKLVAPIDELVWDRYECVPVELQRNAYVTPHMVVRIGDTVFTSAMVFLEKTSRDPVGSSGTTPAHDNSSATTRTSRNDPRGPRQPTPRSSTWAARTF